LDEKTMATESRITINGTALTDEEVMTVRIAMDALADILGEKLGLKDQSVPLSGSYLTAIARVKALLAGGEPESPSMN
jgi:hypothetical protein